MKIVKETHKIVPVKGHTRDITKIEIVEVPDSVVYIEDEFESSPVSWEEQFFSPEPFERITTLKPLKKIFGL